MRKIFLLIIIITISSQINAQNRDFLFRDLSWGSNISEIVAKEGLPHYIAYDIFPVWLNKDYFNPNSINNIADSYGVDLKKSFNEIINGNDKIMFFYYDVIVAGYKSNLTMYIEKPYGLVRGNYDIKMNDNIDGNNYIFEQIQEKLKILYGEPYSSITGRRTRVTDWNINGTKIKLELSLQSNISINYSAPIKDNKKGL